MSKYCPIMGEKVVYLTCLECQDRRCQNREERPETLFDVLRTIRIEHGDVLYDMARKLGCSSAELSGAEHRRKPFPPEWVEQLRVLYDLTPETVEKIRRLAEI